MFISACFFYGASLEPLDWQTEFLFGRLFAGFAHGIAFVTLIVHASENASRDFRHILSTIIAFTVGLSLLYAAAAIYVPFAEITGEQETVKSSEISSADTIMISSLVFCLVSIGLNYFFTSETAPFLLIHNSRDEEALAVLARMNDEDMNSPQMQSELIEIKEMTGYDFVEFPERKIFREIHRKLLRIAVYGRIIAVQTFNVPMCVFFVKIVRNRYELILLNDVIVAEEQDFNESSLAKLKSDFAAYYNIVPVVVAAWVFLGLIFASIANFFNWSRGIYFAVFVTGALIVLINIMYFIGLLTFLFGGAGLLGFYFLLYPMIVDILGLKILLECFPISTKPLAIATVLIVENVYHVIIILIDINAKHYTSNSRDVDLFLMLIGFMFAFTGYVLNKLLPDTDGLSQPAARQAFLQVASNLKKWQ